MRRFDIDGVSCFQIKELAARLISETRRTAEAAKNNQCTRVVFATLVQLVQDRDI